MNAPDNDDAQESGPEDQGQHPPLPGRKAVLMGMLTSGFVIAGAGRPDATAAPPVDPTAASPPPAAPTWTPETAYALGQQVISPNNDVVSAKVAHTSTTTYDADALKWTLSTTFGRPRGNRVAYVGDSITAHGQSGLSLDGRGYQNWANVFTGHSLTITPMSPARYFFAASGDTTTEIIAASFHTLAAASNADIVVVHAGTNDLAGLVTAEATPRRPPHHLGHLARSRQDRCRNDSAAS